MEEEVDKEGKEQMIREIGGGSLINSLEKAGRVSERVVSGHCRDIMGKYTKGVKNSEAYCFSHPSENLNRKIICVKLTTKKKKKNPPGNWCFITCVSITVSKHARFQEKSIECTILPTFCKKKRLGPERSDQVFAVSKKVDEAMAVGVFYLDLSKTFGKLLHKMQRRKYQAFWINALTS